MTEWRAAIIGRYIELEFDEDEFEFDEELEFSEDETYTCMICWRQICWNRGCADELDEIISNAKEGRSNIGGAGICDICWCVVAKGGTVTVTDPHDIFVTSATARWMTHFALGWFQGLTDRSRGL